MVGIETLRRAALVLVAVAPLAQAQDTADFVLTDARVYTVDAERPWAEAVAVRDDRIAAVGSAEEIAA
ncbi:MAG: hypothetical protein V2J02_18275, partial [Pseudomonadales bacterium]|nr:hypothetical protein [Pseudomonadales bacterium]